MSPLNLGCVLGQQVIDILRDRLEFTGGELAETRNRTAELEAAQKEDRDALRKANSAMSAASESSGRIRGQSLC